MTLLTAAQEAGGLTVVGQTGAGMPLLAAVVVVPSLREHGTTEEQGILCGAY